VHSPAYRVYISQLIRYSRACGSYQDFIDRWLLLTGKRLNQACILVKLKSSLRKLWNICVKNDHGYMCVCVCVCVCVRACVRVRARAFVRACVRACTRGCGWCGVVWVCEQLVSQHH
jgi:hypothetical protein